ncbi:hypothetical protein [Alteriqipengyuania lutimaris]|uniref:Uncharacterized protein n=1 Tax=Alteriqipengyuania lutimaris TaxID=1538146 RepID=A0A395LJ87_9SPHN|nr:hypothetical protein [Alteriqipengyuania lutimaris]MBB3034079.1 hypothetical protein [Alteriqipengyuania lutimaris]RDS76982.1 hypothetical protein DL238_04750 [Alteriqipengyuania lutimaris]
MMLFFAQAALLFVAALLACTRGGGPEKLIASVLMLWFVGNAIVRSFIGISPYRSFEVWIFATDLVALGIFVAVALKADRYWTLWLASSQLIAVIGHLLGLVGLTHHPLVYSIFTRLPFWLDIMLLLFGALGARSPAGVRIDGSDRTGHIRTR